MYKAIDIANYIIGYANKIGRSVTNSELQKILYFLQGFYYNKHDEPFISEDFTARRTGPVIEEIYVEFSRYGGLVITNFYESNYKNIKLKYLDKIFLNDAIKLLTKFSTNKLELMATNKNTPWEKAYNNENSKIIPKEEIKRYFRKIKTN